MRLRVSRARTTCTVRPTAAAGGSGRIFRSATRCALGWAFFAAGALGPGCVGAGTGGRGTASAAPGRVGRGSARPRPRARAAGKEEEETGEEQAQADGLPAPRTAHESNSAY